MADRFWIGNGGNTSDTSHWSASSGGAGGASVPTSADNAYFDANSFTLSGQTVTIDAAFNCLDMIWTGTTNTPTLAGSQPLGIYGSLTCISAMVTTYTGQITIRATTTGKTITTAGKLSNSNSFIINGVGGGWTLLDALSTIGNLFLSNGSFNTNGMSVSCGTLYLSGSTTRTMTLGASIITCGSVNNVTTTNLTFSAGTSTIIQSTNGNTFAGGGLTYNNVTFSATPATISGSNTFNTLTLNAGKTLNLTSGTTQTVTSLVCNGTTAAPATLQSGTAASPATIALPAGRYFIRHTSVKDITVSGATAVTSIAGTNVSGNTGITFVTKFEMGRIKNDGSFNWYSTSTGLVTKVSG